MLAQLVGVVDQPVRRGTMDLHAQDEQQFRRLAADPGLARPDVGVPLLEDNPAVLESGSRQGRGNGDRGPGDELLVHEHERSQAGPPVERIDKQDRHIFPRHTSPNPRLQFLVTTRFGVLVTSRTPRQLHGCRSQSLD